ncbi:hypothetical protein GCM10020254_11100 [Streptomyces goshikiensis]
MARAEAAGSFAETADSSVNWPIDIVRSGRQVSGVVVPLIPGDFMRDGKSPRTLDFLSLARANPPRAAVQGGGADPGVRHLRVPRIRAAAARGRLREEPGLAAVAVTRT